MDDKENQYEVVEFEINPTRYEGIETSYIGWTTVQTVHNLDKNNYEVLIFGKKPLFDTTKIYTSEKEANEGHKIAIQAVKDLERGKDISWYTQEGEK